MNENKRRLIQKKKESSYKSKKRNVNINERNNQDGDEKKLIWREKNWKKDIQEVCSIQRAMYYYFFKESSHKYDI